MTDNLGIAARVICDSIGPSRKRLTTLLLHYPRIAHEQFLTHKVLSRNGASSRAIPTSKLIEDVLTNPVMPSRWGANQKGMVAEREIDLADHPKAEAVWRTWIQDCARASKFLSDIGVHKEIANRPMQSCMWMTTLVTATSFDNFFGLRMAEDAQGEISSLAHCMFEAIHISTPRVLGECEWHLPFVTSDDWTLSQIKPEVHGTLEEAMIAISVARCARVSYATKLGYMEDSTSTIDEEIGRAAKCVANGHWSPLEHQAQAISTLEWNGSIRAMLELAGDDGLPFDSMQIGNLCGWIQNRKRFGGEMIKAVRR